MPDKCKKDLARYSRLAYNRCLVGAAGGNISIRSGDKVLITAGGLSLRNISPKNIITLDCDANIIELPNGLKPSKETGMHLSIYKARPDIKCIIHVHPVYVTAYAVRKLPVPILTASSRLKLIETPIVMYAEPGSAELAAAVGNCAEKCERYVKVIILEAHGLISFAEDMDDCFNNAELAEESAKIGFISSNIKGGLL